MASDSLDAVPLPTEIRLIPYFLISALTTCFDSSTLFWGSVGNMTTVSRTFPVGSTTESLHPVLNAGSHPRTVHPAMGGCMRSCFKFLPNTSIAPSSALEVRSLLISLSTAGAMSLSYASLTVSLRRGVVYSLSEVMNFFSRYPRQFSSGALTDTVRIFSASPLLRARTLCPATFLTGSL